MDEVAPKRYLLFTYARTASNVLMRILNLDEQPSIVSSRQRDYFFLPTLKLRAGEDKLSERHVSLWTDAQREGLMEAFQSSFEALRSHTEEGITQKKDVFVKEHVAWLTDPVAEYRLSHQCKMDSESPWTVENWEAQGHSIRNETVLPDEFLRIWLPTFLIRHPAISFPSFFRTSVDLQGFEKAMEDAASALDMTLHWTRSLYDWYAEEGNLPSASGGRRTTWPIVLDADELLSSADLVRVYAKAIGLDPNLLKFSWPATGYPDLNTMPKFVQRMTDTLNNSKGVIAGRPPDQIDITTEAVKWKSEYGEAAAAMIEKRVQAAMPDYEYMSARVLRSQDIEVLSR